MTEGAVTTGDPFADWLVQFGLSKFEASLREAGLQEYGMIANIDDEDLGEIMNDAQLKKFQKKLLKKAVKAVQDGVYPPPPPAQLPPTSTAPGDDTTFSVQQQLQHFQQQLGAAGDQFHQLRQLSQQKLPGGLATEETKGNGGLDEEDDDALSKWLADCGLAKSAAALQEAGLDEYGIIKTLDHEDVEEMIKQAKLTSVKAKAFRKGVKAVKDEDEMIKEAKLKKLKENEQEEESKEPVDQELAKLQESRKHFKGDVELQTDSKVAMDGKKTRTVIFIGQTGAGKTTLINSMCNYLHRVGYDEPFRYKLIVEEKDASVNTKDKTKSQTRLITSYHLRKLPAIDYALNVIDTPGFGDTDGPQRDREIRKQFKQFFESMESIDAIYFVLQSSNGKLGATQKYIFDLVLNLFGDDMEDNIFILFTFSDGAEPPALKAVQTLGVPYNDFYKINNSGFGLPAPDKQDPIQRWFFELGMKQFDIIFKALDNIQTRSTDKTRQTLTERENITTWLFQIGQDVKTAMDQINEMNNTYQYLEAHRTQIDANKDFLIPDTEVIVHHDPVTHNKYTTYCIKCVRTCHKCCVYPDSKKYLCSAMKDGWCTVCKGKCEWGPDIHVNVKYIIRREVKTVMVPKQQMMKKYKLASNEAVKCEDIMKKLLETIDAQEAKIMTTIVKMKESVNRLEQIALNKNVLTNEEYFDTLIDAEKDGREPGWQTRVQQFERLKKEQRLLLNVYHGQEPISWKQNERLMRYKQEFAAKQEAAERAAERANTVQQAPQQVDIDVKDEYKILGKVVYSKTTTTTTTTIQQK